MIGKIETIITFDFILLKNDINKFEEELESYAIDIEIVQINDNYELKIKFKNNCDINLPLCNYIKIKTI